MQVREVVVRRVKRQEESRYQELMSAHHYLGASPKIGETVWYLGVWRQQWVALSTFSAAAWKCRARDEWIGWGWRHQYDRLKLVVNNSRFLILPEWHVANLGSRVLSLCEKRLGKDWEELFGHPVLLMETFVDPERFQGTVYQATNWLYVGDTKGFRRTRNGYSAQACCPKKVFVKPLSPQAQAILSAAILEPRYCIGGKKIMLKAEEMNTLHQCFCRIPDPRRGQGRRHQLATVLSLAAGATLCGARGFQAMWEWARDLSQKARARFRCRVENGRYVIPSLYVIRDVLIRVDPTHLDQAFQRWNEMYAKDDKSLSIDGKTMRNAIDEEGNQTQIMSAVGHQTAICHTQKKSVPCQ